MGSDPFDFLNQCVGVAEDEEVPRPKGVRPPGGLVVPIRLTAAELDFRFAGRVEIIEDIEFVDDNDPEKE